MSATSTAPATAAVSPDALRIVLFGVPNAGKSSLLGALAMAAHNQADLLGGKLDDPTKGLNRQAAFLYRDGSRTTPEEVVAYPVAFHPGPDRDVKATLVDCDGNVVNRILAADHAPSPDSPQGTLASEVVRADALILVIDAASSQEQLEKQFDAFGRFLRLLQQGRGERIEVGGLPVFVVLTKCDLLARKGDSTIDWVDRIEARKRDVDARLREYLAHGKGGMPAFGGVDLHLWDTAVKRPELRGIPAKPREPYHVAELFRQAFERAAAHREQVHGSGRKLAWIAGGAGSLVTLLVGLAIGLGIQGGGEPPSELQRRVEDIMFSDRPTAAERLSLKESDLRRRLAKLEDIRDEPDFPNLPSRFRDFTNQRGKELTAYLTYLDQLRQARAPTEAAREEDLKEIEELLSSKYTLPNPEWSETEAGRLHAQRLKEIETLRDMVRETSNEYFNGAERARKLAAFADFKVGGINWDAWIEEVESLLDPVRADPFPENDKLPDVHSLTWGHVLRFRRAAEARAEWNAARKKLESVRDVAAAVGLVREVKGRPAVLDIPRSDFTLAMAGPRLAELKKAYPKYQTEFVRSNLPEAMLPDLTRAVRTRLEHLNRPAQALVQKRLRETQEPSERWAAVRQWLEGNPEELADWRVLALTLARLEKTDAADPVAAAVAFLKEKSFTLNIRRVILEIPSGMRARPPVGASFEIFHGRSSPAGTALTLAMEGEGQDGQSDRPSRFEFVRKEGGPLTYFPGDDFRASLLLREDRRFTWASPSAYCQFECLLRPPRLHRTNQSSSAGTLADRVRLTIEPADGMPAVPELIQSVDSR